MSKAPMSSSNEFSSRKTSHSTNDKLVYMANQICTFFKSQDVDTASAKTAEHISKFWDPRMRKAIVAHLDAGGADLDPLTQAAVERLRVTVSAI
jgi:formate dehydrogenase subunit delta